MVRRRMERWQGRRPSGIGRGMTGSAVSCIPEEHYPGVLGHLLPSGVVSILGAVSALWRADEFLDRMRTKSAEKAGVCIFALTGT